MSKSSEVRTRIIDTASDLFYRNGFNSTGINEVIREAGVAKATLYAHFRSKDELCLAYLQQRHAAFITNIEAHCRAQPKGTDQLLGLFGFLEAFFNSKDFCGCWAQRTIAELPVEDGILRAEVLAEKKHLTQLVNRLLVDNFPNVPEDILVVAGRKIYLLYEGAVGESYLQNDGWPIRDARDMCQLLLGNF
jgi:AcrR family transcriptional regulator